MEKLKSFLYPHRYWILAIGMAVLFVGEFIYNIHPAFDYAWYIGETSGWAGISLSFYLCCNRAPRIAQVILSTTFLCAVYTFIKIFTGTITEINPSDFFSTGAAFLLSLILNRKQHGT